MSSLMIELSTMIPAIMGGGLIGGSAGLAMYLNGKVLGFSKVMEDAIPRTKFNNKLDGVFSYSTLSGVLAGGSVWYYINPDLFSSVTPNVYPLIFGAACVGNGCTSGHGVCGLARFSKRSLVAVSTFMTVSISMSSTRHLWQHYFDSIEYTIPEYLQGPLVHNSTSMAIVTGVVSSVMLIKAFRIGSNIEERNKVVLSAFPTGAMFASGLIISGMVKPEVVLGFLNIAPIFGEGFGVWNPALLGVFAGAVTVNTLMHSVLSRKRMNSALGLPMQIPSRTDIDPQLVLGASIFGVGWSVLGICPAPALLACIANVPAVLIWLPSFWCGRKLGFIMLQKK